ncbi:MAG: hypothetical protein IPP32_04510 [Bacteroidetes bacterium]|nr:hypothetical protein [Bacteroidota bacterium]
MKIKYTFKFAVLLSSLLLLVGASQAIAQDINPQPLLDSIQQKINKVKDYSADIKIKLDVDFIKIPIREAKIYFKQPDKIKMKSTGFALLPKRGLNFSSGDLLNKKYQAIYIKKELLNKIQTLVVKIVPLEDNSEILLATVWIDRAKQVIRRIDASTKSNGSFTIHFDYPIVAYPFDLPQTLTFDFDVNKMEIPAAISGDYNTEKPKEKKAGPSRGKIILNYTNYSVNKGIPDSFFIEKKD